MRVLSFLTSCCFSGNQHEDVSKIQIWDGVYMHKCINVRQQVYIDGNEGATLFDRKENRFFCLFFVCLRFNQ